jgi:hypothetical protein
MTHYQHHHTKSIDHQPIAHSRERMRSPKFLPSAPNQPSKPFSSFTNASARPKVSAATDETNAHTDL